MKHIKQTVLKLASGLLLTLMPALSIAMTPQEQGLAIVTEVERRDQGWESSEADMVMTLRNKHGDESTREIHSKSLEVQGDGDKSLTVFDRPKDVKGTAFLTFSHAVEADDQWLYLPALKRVKRISSRNKSGPFMGSEFAYEDMSSFELAKYHYRYLKDEVLDGQDCYVIESEPVDPFSGYTRLITWFDKAEYRAQKIDYYDRKNALLKTLRFSQYQQYLQRYWRPATMQMDNHQTGKSTTLNWTNYRFKTGLDDQDFNKNSLKRAK